MINPISTGNNITEYNNANNKAQEAKQGEFEKALEKAMEEKDEKKLKKACNDLEAVFLGMMFKQMRNTVQKSGLIEDGTATEMYEDMLFEQYTEEITKGKGTGLGDMLYRQLAKSMKKESEDKNAE